ncbi:hypothetical protein [Frigidibacter oleivorans]|uniref:hypothetical protein n=1 Tax=Frigidibacter oleivorans TaxID=2487129 RepID=UPI000F8CA94F|nr:hypothetical protein [Frigidibacter oleivorans]
MTALSEYQRLECPGLWRGSAAGQRRDVIVSLGDATVVISDSRSERALTHWSLPAVERLNPGDMPALYAPGPDSDETLELDEPAMVEALDKVRHLIEARRPHPGRLRLALTGAVALGVAALGLLWLPGAMVDHTAAALPFATRQAVGQILLDDLARVGGPPCSTRLGDAALARLSLRLFGPDGGRIVVMREAIPGAVPLPGRFVVANRALIEAEESPEVLAGHALAARLRAELQDPMRDLLHRAGIGATFRLLTTGELAPSAIAGQAEEMLHRAGPDASPPPDPDTLLTRFAAAGVSSSPYAWSIDPSGETVLPLIEADPYPAGAGPQGPVLTDADWVALQGICQG